MPPKKRDSENDVAKKPKAKRQKKKKDDFTDSESDAEIEQNNGNGASVDEPDVNYDIVCDLFNKLFCLPF